MYDVIVVGAGPGGATAATLMSRRGLRVLLVDRESFPRDKVCGDAISGKSVDVLRELGLAARVQQAEAVDTWGITFSGPSGATVSIPFTKDFDRDVAPGFVCRREVFDQMLFETALNSGAEVWQNTLVEDLVWDGAQVAGVRLRRADTVETVRSRLVVGADGAYSIVARKLGMSQLDEDHYAAALRSYYEGVEGFHEHNFLEIHFVDEASPGYFWVFPLPDGRANVGLGMLSSEIKARGIKLKPMLDDLVASPLFRGRFANARRVGRVTGWGLPLGSKPRKMAGSGWLLIGDAASLIDPFTGEGIGNAMVGASVAAEWASRSVNSGDVSAKALAGFEREMHEMLDGELRLSTWMLRLLGWRWPLDLVVRKASRSPELADAISCMFDDLSERRKLVSPLFYLRLLTA